MRKPIRLLALAAVLAIGALPAAAFGQARTDITLGMVLEPPNLDPTAGAAAAIDEVVYANVFEGLVRIGPSGEVLPALAESWTVSDDGKVYLFKLRTGVKFHDETDFTAEDARFSLDRARDEKSTNAQKTLFAAIEAEQHQALREIAFAERRSLADVVREALNSFLAQHPARRRPVAAKR